MDTGFLHIDSYILPVCPLVPISTRAAADEAEPTQDEVDAAQALAAYRRIEESCDDTEMAEVG